MTTGLFFGFFLIAESGKRRAFFCLLAQYHPSCFLSPGFGSTTSTSSKNQRSVVSFALSGSAWLSSGHTINKLSSSAGATNGRGNKTGSGIAARGLLFKNAGTSTPSMMQRRIAASHGLIREIGPSNRTRSFGLEKNCFLASSFRAFLFTTKASITSFLFFFLSCFCSSPKLLLRWWLDLHQ